MPSLPYRIAARWDLDLWDADRKTGRAVSGALVGTGFIGIAVGAGLGALLAGLAGIDLKWIMWLATPGWVVLLFGCAISADLTVHRDLDGLSPVSHRLLSHWVVTSLLFALPWALLAPTLSAWIEAQP